MSYLHCPTCKRAYNIAISTQCPNCPVPVQLVDAAEDIVVAAEALARAMARATPDERDDAMGRMDRLALPAPGAKPVTFHGAMLRTIREAVGPTQLPPPPKPQPLLAAVAQSLIERATDRIVDLRERIERRAPRLKRITARLRALAA